MQLNHHLGGPNLARMVTLGFLFITGTIFGQDRDQLPRGGVPDVLASPFHRRIAAIMLKGRDRCCSVPRPEQSPTDRRLPRAAAGMATRHQPFQRKRFSSLTLASSPQATTHRASQRAWFLGYSSFKPKQIRDEEMAAEITAQKQRGRPFPKGRLETIFEAGIPAGHGPARQSGYSR